MSDVDDGRRMLAEFRAAMQPSAHDRARVAAGLAARSRAVWMRGLVVRCTIAAIAAACLLAFALQWLGAARHTGADAPRHDGAAVDEVEPRDRDDGRATQRTRSAPAVESIAPTLPAAPSSPTPVRRDAARPDRQSAPNEPQPATELDTVRAEAALIDRARQALDAEQYDRVLAITGEHGRKFPQGTLVIEARALRALALCLAGQRKQGRGEALVFLRERPDAPYHARIRRSCGLDDGP